MRNRKDYLALARIELARMGGRARSEALSKEERVEIARLGGKAGGRGRKRGDRLPDELRERIWALLAGESAAALWWLSDAAKRPRTRGLARRALDDLARNGSLPAYKAAREMARCLD